MTLSGRRPASRRGYILTNNHVVENADEVKVALLDGRELTAKVIGKDPKSDVAVLKVEASDLPVVEITNSDNLEVGDVVLAIGNPFGIGQTVTMGIVSAIGSSASYKDVLENPDSISRKVLESGLDSQTAFEIVSIDIADIDVGENIGARLQADQAEAERPRRKRSLLLVGPEGPARETLAEGLRQRQFQVFAIADGAEPCGGPAAVDCHEVAVRGHRVRERERALRGSRARVAGPSGERRRSCASPWDTSDQP